MTHINGVIVAAAFVPALHFNEHNWMLARDCITGPISWTRDCYYSADWLESVMRNPLQKNKASAVNNSYH